MIVERRDSINRFRNDWTMNDWKWVQGENDLRFLPIPRVEIKIYMKYEGTDIFRIVFNLKTW